MYFHLQKSPTNVLLCVSLWYPAKEAYKQMRVVFVGLFCKRDIQTKETAVCRAPSANAEGAYRE